MGRLEGKVALITGGARGQGAAEGTLFASEGASVVITDVLDKEGEQTAAGFGGKYLHHDVTDENAWSSIVEEVLELHGKIDVLVNNAGIWLTGSLANTRLADYRRVIEVNQIGVFLGMQAVAPAMIEAHSGSIINISSVAGLRGSPGAIAYSATKWALRGMTKAAAIDLAPRRIRVNSVHPGPIDTEMLKVRTPEQNEQRLQLVPMRRMGTADEVASLVLFLLSDESAYITGAEVAIDGGATL